MTIPQLLIGGGILLIALGILFLKTHYAKTAPNEELEWAGFGEHPFRKR